MSDDAFAVLELPRGETDVLRVTRKTYEGRPFTDLRLFFRGDDGQLHPTRRGVSVRDHELAEVIGALKKIATKIGPQAPREQRRSPGRREILTTAQPADEDRSADMEAF